MSETEDTKQPERVLTEQEEKDIRESFDELDKDGNGVIEASEFVLAWRKIGENPTDEEVDSALKAMDRNNDDVVSFEEFRKFIIDTPVKSPEERKEELVESFKRFDKNGDGFVRRNELRAALSSEKGKHPMSEEELEEMFSMIDANSDGKINIDEFVSFLLEQSEETGDAM